IVINLGLSSLRCLGGEHAATADAGDLQLVLADDARSFIETNGCDLIPPGGDGGYPGAKTSVHGFGKAPLLAGGGEIERNTAIRAHAETPCTASTCFIRWVASSGSASTRALSARRNSSARCWIERVDC